jgi:tetratricopeptide (TPR) repeat protein
MSALDLAMIAVKSNSRELAMELLPIIRDAPRPPDETASGRLQIAHVVLNLLLQLGELDEAQNVATTILAEMDQVEHGHDFLRRELLSDLATLARYSGDFRDSFEAQLDSLEVARITAGARLDNNVIRAMSNAVDSAIDAGEIERAEEMWNELEDRLRSDADGDHHMSAGVLAIRGRLNLHCGNLAEALSDLRSALKESNHKGVVANSWLPAALINISQVYRILGATQLAIDAAEEALSIDLVRYGDQHPETQIDLEVIGKLRGGERVPKWARDPAEGRLRLGYISFVLFVESDSLVTGGLIARLFEASLENDGLEWASAQLSSMSVTIAEWDRHSDSTWFTIDHSAGRTYCLRCNSDSWMLLDVFMRAGGLTREDYPQAKGVAAYAILLHTGVQPNWCQTLNPLEGETYYAFWSRRSFQP